MAVLSSQNKMINLIVCGFGAKEAFVLSSPTKKATTIVSGYYVENHAKK